MQFIPRRTVTLDVSLPQVTICHEHELGCCRIPAVYSLSLAPSWVLQQLLPSQGPKSFFHPLKSIVRLVPSLLRPVCSYHVPKKASSCFKVSSSHYSGGHLIMCRKSGDLSSVYLAISFFLQVTVSGRKRVEGRGKFNRAHLRSSPPSRTEFSCLLPRDLE